MLHEFQARMHQDITHFTGPGRCLVAQSSCHTGCSTGSIGSGSGSTAATAGHTGERQREKQIKRSVSYKA